MFNNTGFLMKPTATNTKQNNYFLFNVPFMCLQRLLKVLVANQGLEKNNGSECLK